MDLHIVRSAVKDTLKSRRLTQYAFARKHDLSYSWLNKFLREEADNPCADSLTRLQKALENEAAEAH